MTRLDTAVDAPLVPGADVLLEVTGLSVEFRINGQWTRVVDDLSFSLRRSEVLGFVGESGSGKSVTALAVAGLTRARGGRIASGSVYFDGIEMTALPDKRLRAERGANIGMIFQQPTSYLNPAFTVGEQVAETVRLNMGLSRTAAWDRAVSMLDRVGIPRAGERAIDYPHQFSGGMCQRVMIAIALACEPKLLIADEPTTALDVTVQARILELMQQIQEDTGIAIIFVTHDLSLVAGFCDRALVMYGGQGVEYNTTRELLTHPAHPYTEGLLGAARMQRINGRLPTVPGMAPRPGRFAHGCRFSDRCGHFVAGRCDTAPPLLGGDGRWSRCCRVGEIELVGLSPP